MGTAVHPTLSLGPCRRIVLAASTTPDELEGMYASSIILESSVGYTLIMSSIPGQLKGGWPPTNVNCTLCGFFAQKGSRYISCSNKTCRQLWHVECLPGSRIPKANAAWRCGLHAQACVDGLNAFETLFQQKFIFPRPPRAMLEDELLEVSTTFAGDGVKVPSEWLSLRNASALEFSRSAISEADLREGVVHLLISYGRRSLVVAVGTLHPTDLFGERGYDFKDIFVQRHWRSQKIFNRLLNFARREVKGAGDAFLVVDLQVEKLGDAMVEGGVDNEEHGKRRRFWFMGEST